MTAPLWTAVLGVGALVVVTALEAWLVWRRAQTRPWEVR
jgi:hypothetical protein